MEPVSHLIRSSIPKYLAGLPVPNSFLGFFKLSFRELISLTPLGLIVAGTGYLSYRALFGTQAKLDAPATTPAKEASPPASTKKAKVNESIKKDSSKVVDTFDIEEIGDKKVFCRCWRSKQFPYCDGSHGAHNKETGDNVGPLIIKKSE